MGAVERPANHGGRDRRWTGTAACAAAPERVPDVRRVAADETPHGVRVFEGRWADGYLGRHPVRTGYAYVIWKGRHVAEPGELSAEEAAGFWSEVARAWPERWSTGTSRPR